MRRKLGKTKKVASPIESFFKYNWCSLFWL